MKKKTAETAKAPPELDSTMKSILEEAQNNEEFRTCLLLNNNVELRDSEKNMVKNSDCLKNQLEKALPAFSPWDYGFAICDGTATDNCVMFNSTNDEIGGITKLVLPTSKTIYTKSSVLAVPDVVAKPFLVRAGACCILSPPPIINCDSNPSYNDCCELNERIKDINSQNCIAKTGKTIYLYLWDKQ